MIDEFCHEEDLESYMNRKILRLTLHSDAPMHGDATKLLGFFAASLVTAVKKPKKKGELQEHP